MSAGAPWMYDADGVLMPPGVDLYEELRLTEPQWQAWWAVWDQEAGSRSRGRNGVKLLHPVGDPTQPRWVEVIDALVAIDRIAAADRDLAVRAEWVKYAGCPGCGSSGAFVRRDKSGKYEKGQVRVSCGRRCRTRDVLKELGIEVLPDLDQFVTEWVESARKTAAASTVQHDPDAATEAALQAAARRARDVAEERYRLEVREAAREQVAAARAGEMPPFDAGTLAELLAREQAARFRVESLIPADAGTLVSAKRKAGKTTFGLNLARCLLTGEDFLDRFAVQPLTGRVGVLNFEVSAQTFAGWADEAGVPHDRLVVVNLRGRRNPLAHPEDRAELAAYLRGHEVEAVIVDPFGRAYTGTSQNDAGEVGSWLAVLDRWCRAEVGATDVVLTAHAGWDGERTRGSSALEDWADVVLTLTRGRDDDGESPDRFLKAIGRDVELEEDRLGWDAARRTLTLTGSGSRRVAEQRRAVESALADVLAYVGAHPDCSQRAVEQALDVRRETAREALREAVSQGLVERQKRGQAFVHRLCAPRAPAAPGALVGGAPVRPYRGAPTTHQSESDDDGAHHPSAITDEAALWLGAGNAPAADVPVSCDTCGGSLGGEPPGAETCGRCLEVLRQQTDELLGLGEGAS